MCPPGAPRHADESARTRPASAHRCRRWYCVATAKMSSNVTAGVSRALATTWWSSAGVEVVPDCFADDVGSGHTVAFGACCDLVVELGVEADRFDG